ncbi:MAG TPA: T9SS type A sorting domain-containing protein, partial [Saprospiraceae bacterium]|nr:T9SS type A sorting domain-containing protein [Saprospiraceae bacterium]
IEKVRMENQSLIVQMRNVNGYAVLILDTAFSIVDQHNITFTPELAGLSIFATTDFIYAWRLDGISSYKANYRICFQHDDAQPIQYIDIGWEDMWVDSVSYWPWEMHLPAKVFILGVVRNFSPDTIHDFVMHFQDDLFCCCDDGVRETFFTGRNIAPGQTDTIYFQTYSWELYQGESFIREYFIEHANHHLDSVISDNQFTLVYFPDKVEVIAEEDPQVSPNPFADFISVSANNISLELVLLDQMGRVVSQGQNQLDDLAALPAGIYFLQIHVGDKSMVKKMVKLE